MERTIPFGNFGLLFKKSSFLEKICVRGDRLNISVYVPFEISGIFEHMLNNLNDIGSSWKHNFFATRAAGMVQWWECSPPAKGVWFRFRFWFEYVVGSRLAQARVFFSLGTQVYLPAQNPTSPNSNSTRLVDPHENQLSLMCLSFYEALQFMC